MNEITFVEIFGFIFLKPLLIFVFEFVQTLNFRNLWKTFLFKKYLRFKSFGGFIEINPVRNNISRKILEMLYVVLKTEHFSLLPNSRMFTLS